MDADEKLSQLMSDGLSAIASPAGQIQTPASTVKRKGDMTNVSSTTVVSLAQI